MYVTTVCPGLLRVGGQRRSHPSDQPSPEYALFAASDDAPALPANATRTARRIVEACRYAEAELVIGAPARAAAWVHGLLPGMTSEALSILNRLLPKSRPSTNHDAATDP